MTRIAVLSDIHGNLPALEATLAAIKAERPDEILVAGDLVFNGPDPGAVVDALRALESDGAAVVSGNTDIAVTDFDFGAAFPHYQDGVPDGVRIAAEWAHDELSDEQLAWLRRLPSERRVRADDDSLVLVVHASPQPSVTTTSAARITSSVNGLGNSWETSTPSSLIASTPI